MRNPRLEKGRSLERAVRLIQKAILDADPGLEGTEFRIESNRIMKVAGVHHEIDVLVTTSPNTNFESVWIFECKNWAKAVDKNVVALLARKVQVLHANRGFLVAHRLSKDAAAELDQDGRLRFIRCSDQFLSSLHLHLIHVMHDVLPLSVSIHERDISWKQAPLELDWQKLTCELRGSPISFRAMIEEEIGRAVSRDRQENAPRYRLEGTHWGEFGLEVKYERRELMIDGMDVERIAFPVRFFVHVQKRVITSKFELESQGRVFSFEPIEDVTTGTSIEIHVVQRL